MQLETNLSIFFNCLILVSANILFAFPTDDKTNYNDSEMTIKQRVNTVNKYAVVVDCGSSGTRAHIFSWPSDTTNEDLPSKMKPMKNETTGEPLIKRIQPGLSIVKDNPDTASDYMKPIMDFINFHIPDEIHNETDVYFMGTAGLRLLTENERKQILDDISRDLIEEYKFKNLHTEVISGTQEGTYQWLSVNAHGGRLVSDYNQTGKIFYCQAPRARRYGMLELGGASAQVTFELTPELKNIFGIYLRPFPDALNAYKKSQVHFDLGQNKTLNLFSTTFLGFGSDSARNIAVDLIVRDAIKLPNGFSSSIGNFVPLFYSVGSTFLVEDPCLPVGAQETMNKPVELLYNQSKTIGFNSGSASDEMFTVRLIGKGNYFLCQILLNRVLLVAKKENLNCKINDKSCSVSLIGTNFVPFQYLQFLGLSEFYYTTKEILEAAGQFNPIIVLTRIIKICSTPYETLLEHYSKSNQNDSKRVLQECFKATWMMTWLKSGLRMPFNYLTDFRTLNNLNGNNLDWTYGALIEKLLKQSSDVD